MTKVTMFAKPKPTFGVGSTHVVVVEGHKPFEIEQFVEDNSGRSVFRLLSLLHKNKAVEFHTDAATRDACEDY